MCGFQSPGQGFFYFPDASKGRQSKARANSIVITVLEGATTTRELEDEFNGFFRTTWRCTVRAISPNQFIMRLPNPRDVEQACYYGKRMEMSDGSAVLNLSPWSPNVGAKAPLQKAWVRVRNIPEEKRCIANIAYAGSIRGNCHSPATRAEHRGPGRRCRPCLPSTQQEATP